MTAVLDRSRRQMMNKKDKYVPTYVEEEWHIVGPGSVHTSCVTKWKVHSHGSAHLVIVLYLEDFRQVKC